MSTSAHSAHVVSFRLNGHPMDVEAEGGESLLSVLRDQIGMRGTKNACTQGECGSCTVHIDGTPVCSCLVPVGQCADASITTIEGLAATDTGARLQQAFITAGAVQCGFCTPGLVMQAAALQHRPVEDDEMSPAPLAFTDNEIREHLSGNLCRCTGYDKIVNAVRAAVNGEPS
ncbi:(2Fe-2S)-binding protein [Gordonia jinhuaensis]|uniref:Carbon-monoxide dehydrogenase small subunit n=1 Tax=Gordonia jinhuaensis TaxID=1517702 RepID=A0A916TI77_9ACTN|nr:(2Fe-2S)-binding protein [Gordonia jinhuaensis]GGB46158.1 carbon-monoxide dehydrogenase small subunit [Gordonia jinhuaensis]